MKLWTLQFMTLRNAGKENSPAEIPNRAVQLEHIQKGAMRIKDGWKMSQNCQAIATAPTIQQVLQELYANVNTLSDSELPHRY